MVTVKADCDFEQERRGVDDMTSGWIKLHRQIRDHELWTSERFTRGQAWVDLLMLANYEPNTIRIRGIEVVIDRGQLAWSKLHLSERWHWDRKTVTKYIEELSRRKMILNKTSRLTTVISIVNYDSYQKNTQQNPQQNGQQKGHREEVKESKEGLRNYNIPALAFVKPTVEDISNYCMERKNTVDPQAWIDHYASNGWKVGKNPMKDWKAAVRTWERNNLGGKNGNGKQSFFEQRQEQNEASRAAVRARLGMDGGGRKSFAQQRQEQNAKSSAAAAAFFGAEPFFGGRVEIKPDPSSLIDDGTDTAPERA